MDFKNLSENKWAMHSLIGVTLLMGTYGLVKLYFSQKRKSRRAAYPKDVVILHQFPVNPAKPALSFYCLKIETFLKTAGINYQNEYSFFDRSPKGKLPYITLNGEDISDSYFAIQWLTEKLEKDLDNNLSSKEKAISRAFYKLIEESFKWALLVQRFQYGTKNDIDMPGFIFRILGSKQLGAAKLQGYGTHSQAEVYQIGNADLKAIEDYLGDKKYFFGDKLTTVDTIIFAFIAQIVFYDKRQFNTYLRENCHNLMRHYKSIKNEFWYTWNE